jgi:hypothetical protein
MDYTRYTPGQKPFWYLSGGKESNAYVTAGSSNLSAFSRFSFRQNVYQSFTYNNADITLTSYIRRVNLNLSAYGNWRNGDNPNIYGNFGLGLPTWWGLTTRLQSQFDFTNQNFVTLRAEFEKRISQQGYLSLVGENNFQSDYRALTLAFRWTLPFSQVNLSTRLSNNDFMTTKGAGGFGFGSGNGYVHTTDVHRRYGRIDHHTFVDIDHNGKETTRTFVPICVRLTTEDGSFKIGGSIIRIVGSSLTPILLTIFDKSLDRFHTVSFTKTCEFLSVPTDSEGSMSPFCRWAK